MIEHQDWVCPTNKLCNEEGRRQDKTITMINLVEVDELLRAML